MSKNKKEIRNKFRDDVFERDKYTCKLCDKKCSLDLVKEIMDAHHIVDRTLMPNGGYVPENGITLCKNVCHAKAEIFHNTGIIIEGISPKDLYFDKFIL